MELSARKRLMGGIVAGMAALFAGATALAFVAPRLKPPAPGPTYMSSADHTRLTGIAASVKKKQFIKARTEIAFIDAPIAKSLGEWIYFMGENPLVNISDAGDFLDTHSDWPAASRIQSFVESRIPDNASHDLVLAFFDTRDPITGDGKVQLARAMFSIGEKEAGEIYLRDAWVNHNFTASEERRILANYGGRLTKADHAARVDRLLWSRQVTNARRVFSRLNTHDRRLAQARAALLMRASSGPNLYRKLSADDQRDSGVLHAAVRYYRRSGEEQYATSLARMAPSDPALLRNSAQWWTERRMLMRWAMKEGRFADAYSLAANHSIEDGVNHSDAEFSAGWIALRFLDQPERAETHFLALASIVRTPISVSRAYYWLGRTDAARGKLADAKANYLKAAQHHYSFYGQLAAKELGAGAPARQFGPIVPATPTDKALFTSRPTVAALRMLSDLGLDYEFMVFAYHIDDQLERPGEYMELAKITNGEGAPHLTVRAGKVGIRRNAFAADVAYPLIFVPDEAARFVSPEIILGLSRQESEFNPRAYSSAGARGLMQLMPATAQLTARKERLRYSRSALLDDPIYNMTIGSAHLSHLIDRFDGSLVMTFAAYNAGPHRVDQWVEDFGDPRSANVDPLDWIELVPFSETRNYIQRVLENTQVYRGRLNNTSIGDRLSSDIERGGGNNRVARMRMPSARLAAQAARHNAQILPPLPVRTAERVEAFRLAQAEVHVKPAPAEPSTIPTGETSDQPSAEATAPPLAHPAAGADQDLTPDQGAPATNDEAIAPAPIAMTSADETTLQIADTGDDIQPHAAATPPPPDHGAMAPSLAQKLPASPVEKNVAINTATNAPASVTPGIPADLSVLQSQIAAVIQPAPASDPNADDPDDVLDECLTYRDFLARNAEDEEAAADLNAGMLAELQGAGNACG